MNPKRPVLFLLGRFVFSLLVLLFILKFDDANADATTACEIVPPFYQTVHNSLHFRDVEMVARNHDIGLYRGGVVQLHSWIEVESGAYLGIDRDGRVLNVIQLPERNIAFLLSGKRVIKDIFLAPPSDLFAIDQQGEILRFNRPIWNTSVLPSIVRRALGNYVGAMCTVGAGAAVISWFGLSLWSPEVLVAIGLGSSGSMMLESFRAMVSYQQQNETTDGFDRIGRRFKGWRSSDYDWNEQGQVRDYVLRGRSGAVHLSDLVENFVTGQLAPDFHRKCEYDLLARGIPPENYEPQFK